MARAAVRACLVKPRPTRRQRIGLDSHQPPTRPNMSNPTSLRDSGRHIGSFYRLEQVRLSFMIHPRRSLGKDNLPHL